MSADSNYAAQATKSGSIRYLWASIAAAGCSYFIVPAFHIPVGARSHYSFVGTVLAVVTGVLGGYGFFRCPRHPVLLKLGTAPVCLFSAAIAISAVIQFIRFGHI